MLMLYQGLRDEVYYWELINTVRKIVMVAINVFMSTLPLVYAALTAVLALIFLIRLQINLSPYKLDLNNNLEIDAMITGTATLFCGILFISDESDMVVVVLFVLSIIIAINVRYFLVWLLCMLATLYHKHEFFRSTYNLIAMLLMRRQFAQKLIQNPRKSSKSKWNPR